MALAFTRIVFYTGNFLRDHASLLRNLQWFLALFYLFLIIVPATLPLPDSTSSILNHLTIFSQFVFWGIWWPFVLVSIVMFGRVWCGWLCPEGMLSEWASERGKGRPIPKWMRWKGWPFVAFSCTTVYGQLISVYQYPLAVLLILGGSTVAAMIIGWRYGRSKRVWCRYLCPVNGVFNLLAKLSPWHFKVDEKAWRSPSIRIQPINCAPLVPIRHMKGAGDCHMCGRCSQYRGAIALSFRSPEEEIIEIGDGDCWQTILICFGLMGIALGAFLWSASPWYIVLKQWIASWLINHNILWPLENNAPWFILTNYATVNDAFSWLDGISIILFILGTTCFGGGASYLSLWLIDKSSKVCINLHHLAQSLIPLAGMGVFLGLSTTTITLLENEGLKIFWINPLRLMLLLASLLWSLRLFLRLLNKQGIPRARSITLLLLFVLGLIPFCMAWIFFFLIW